MAQAGPYLLPATGRISSDDKRHRGGGKPVRSGGVTPKWGLVLWIEHEGLVILYDTGLGPALMMSGLGPLLAVRGGESLAVWRHIGSFDVHHMEDQDGGLKEVGSPFGGRVAYESRGKDFNFVDVYATPWPRVHLLAPIPLVPSFEDPAPVRPGGHVGDGRAARPRDRGLGAITRDRRRPLGRQRLRPCRLGQHPLAGAAGHDTARDLPAGRAAPGPSGAAVPPEHFGFPGQPAPASCGRRPLHRRQGPQGFGGAPEGAPDAALLRPALEILGSVRLTPRAPGKTGQP
ncbi:hypothetical protein DFAR_2770004 [Desulfarculales bacterium]